MIVRGRVVRGAVGVLDPVCLGCRRAERPAGARFCDWCVEDGDRRKLEGEPEEIPRGTYRDRGGWYRPVPWREWERARAALPDPPSRAPRRGGRRV